MLSRRFLPVPVVPSALSRPRPKVTLRAARSARMSETMKAAPPATRWVPLQRILEHLGEPTHPRASHPPPEVHPMGKGTGRGAIHGLGERDYHSALPREDSSRSAFI